MTSQEIRIRDVIRYAPKYFLLDIFLFQSLINVWSSLYFSRKQWVQLRVVRFIRFTNPLEVSYQIPMPCGIIYNIYPLKFEICII